MSRLVRYEPLSVLNDINKLFEQTFPLQNNRDSSYVESAQWVPAVDIKEETSSFTLYVDLPGMDKSEITISMENNVLTLQGDRKNGKNEKEYYRLERASGKFYRRFTLPETADESKIAAKMEKGVLTITIPKKEASKPRSIQIHGE